MKTKFSLTVLLIAAFLLSACGGGAATPSPTPLPPLPTFTSTPVPPTATFTITPSPTPTNTPFVPKFTFKIVSNSPFTTDVARGAELAVLQLSLPLQELGIKIEYVAYDDQSDIDLALKNAKEIAADPSVLCGVGHYYSRISIAASDVYHLAKLAFISPASTAPKLTDRGYPEISRVTGRDDNQGASGAQFAQSKGFKSAFVVTADSDYARRNADSFKKEAGKLGIAIVGDFAASVQSGTYEAVLAKLMTANSDMVYFSSFAQDAGPFFKLAREAGYQGTFFGPDGLDDPVLLETAGPLLANGGDLFISSNAAPASFHPEAAGFLESFQVQFGALPQLYAAEAYDAAGVCLKAIEEATRAKGGEAPTREEVAKAVRALREYKGITGLINFNKNGDLTPATYYVYQVVTADPGKWWEHPIIASFQVAPPE